MVAISIVRMETINGVSPPKVIPEYLLEALHQKRRSLDLDVERYKALKDEEFQHFESDLRRVIEKQSFTHSTPEAPKAHPNISPTFQMEKIGTPLRRNSDEKSPVGTMLQRLRIEEEGTSPMPESNAALEAMEDPIKHENNELPEALESSTEPLLTLSHDREVEFHGLFTPSYLPLLEAPHRPSKHNMRNSPSQPPSKETEFTNLRDDSSAPLSSSATPTVMTYRPFHSPLQSPKLSNSVDRPQLSNQRRSSSKSDISITSLRSSLKQPKTLRSPKHVLFAIGNTVLSPSTSPEVSRNEKVPPILLPFSGLKDVPKQSTSRSNNIVQRIENGREAARQSSMSSGSQFPDRSYEYLVEPNATKSGTMANDFEDMGPDEDVLFSFDEDVNQNGAHANFDDDDIDEGPELDEDTEPTTASPHSGSLPIEIKWPARKDPRK